MFLLLFVTASYEVAEVGYVMVIPGVSCLSECPSASRILQKY